MTIAVNCFGLLLVVAAATAAPQDYRTTPVPILKQISRHNDDGSYSFGYEAADGSFKIETKYPSGEVVGKYGYVGDDGKLRQVEYGASRRGFEPSGTDINVPPPTLNNDSPSPEELDYDDGQYREDPSIYDRPIIAAQHRFAPVRPQQLQPTPQPQPLQPIRYQSPQYSNYRFQTPQYNNFRYQAQRAQPIYRQPSPRPQLVQQHSASQYQRIQQIAQSNLGYNPFLLKGHPASNVNLLTGSYTISY